MTYTKFRSDYFAKQGGAETYEKVNFRATKLQNDEPLDQPYLQPRKHIFFKDIWHCPNAAEARKIAHTILKYKDVTYLKLKGTWVWVDYTHQGKGTSELPGQQTDDREKKTGRSL